MSNLPEPQPTMEIKAGELPAWLVAILVIGFIVVFAWAISDHKKSPAPVPSSQGAPCSTDQKPCIQLTAPDGTKYKLNDFRFLPDHCIAILSLPDNTTRKICGDYKLDWIRPNTTKGIKPTIAT